MGGATDEGVSIIGVTTSTTLLPGKAIPSSFVTRTFPTTSGMGCASDGTFGPGLATNHQATPPTMTVPKPAGMAASSSIGSSKLVHPFSQTSLMESSMQHTVSNIRMAPIVDMVLKEFSDAPGIAGP